MSLLRDILGGYLYYDQVQRLASDHDLPVSRTKDELIDELVEGGYLDPDEVVAYLRVDDLRDICAELGIPSGASRDVLADRVADALLEDERPTLPRKKRQAPQAAIPRSPAQALDEGVVAPSRVNEGEATRLPPLSIHLTLPSTSPAGDRGSAPELSKAGWGFVGVVFTVVFAAAIPLSIYAFGIIWGSLLALGAGLVTAVLLVLTAGSWSSWVDRRFQKRG